MKTRACDAPVANREDSGFGYPFPEGKQEMTRAFWWGYSHSLRVLGSKYVLRWIAVDCGANWCAEGLNSD